MAERGQQIQGADLLSLLGSGRDRIWGTALDYAHCLKITTLKALLQEAARVSRKHIIVKDHYWTNWIGLHLLKLSDFIGNKCYGIRLPYNFLTLEEWSELWKVCELDVLECQKLRVHFMDICQNIQFKLRIPI